MTTRCVQVQTLFTRYYVGRRSTDYLYYWNLKELEKHYPIQLQQYTSVPVTSLVNTTHLVAAILQKLRLDPGIISPTLWTLFRRSIIMRDSSLNRRADVVFTNFHFPLNPITPPIVLEWDFFPFGLPSEAARIRRAIYVPEWFVRRAKIVCVRHDLSLGSYQTMFPQYADKATLLPFYLPWLEAIPEEDVLRKYEGFRTGPIRMLFVGNLARLKGLPFLIEAYGMLRSKYPRLELVVVSEFRDGRVEVPPEVKILSNLRRTEVYKLMAESHIVAMTSRGDAIGIVCWEAMANGCALLVPDISPQREMFGPFGLTAYPTSTEDIGAALERMIMDRDFCVFHALLARRAFLEKFHHSVVGRQYYEMFARAAYEPGGKGVAA